MFLSLFRAPLRQAALTGARSLPKAQFRASFRNYSTTPPPAAKSNKSIWIGLGAVAGVGGLAFYFYENERNAVKSGIQVAKVKANFVPTKDDYQKVGWVLFSGMFDEHSQKVYNTVADLLDANDYDGMCRCRELEATLTRS